MRTGIAAASLFLTASAEVRSQDPVKADLDRLQGTWRVVSTAWDGTTTRAAEGDEAVVTGDELVPSRGGKDQELRFTVQPGTAPKGIDLAPREGPAGDHLQGIYRLNRDALVLCYRLPVRPESVGKSRPTEFKAGPKSDTMMVTLERAAAKRSRPAARGPTRREPGVVLTTPGAALVASVAGGRLTAPAA